MKLEIFKPTLSFSLIFVAAVSALGQGNVVSFSNFDVPRGVNAPFYDSDGTTRLAGENYLASLYVGPAGTPVEYLVRIGTPQPFRTGNLAGYWVPANIPVPGVAPGGAILAQVRFWDSQGGTFVTFEQAQGSGAKVGFSLVLQLILSPSGSTPLTGLRSASLIPVPLAISTITSRVINQNTSTGPIPFTVVGSDPSSLLMTGTSSNPSLIRPDCLVFGGSGSNRTVTITPLLDQFGTATIALFVRDASGGSASSAFTVTVVPVNDVMRLHIIRESTNTTVTWTATNGVLQQCDGTNGDWNDVVPEAASPYEASSEATTFYRLRRR